MFLPASKSLLIAVLVLGASSVLGGAPSAAGPGPMQVEEPSALAVKPPIQPEQDREKWKSRKTANLTASQKAALKARQETMKDMMTLVQQKRRAIREARPEDRQALAQELHNLILEHAQGSERAREAGRENPEPAAESIPSANARTQEAAQEPKDRGSDLKERGFEHRENNLRQQESLRRRVEERPGAGNKKDD